MEHSVVNTDNIRCNPEGTSAEVVLLLCNHLDQSREEVKALITVNERLVKSNKDLSDVVSTHLKMGCGGMSEAESEPLYGGSSCIFECIQQDAGHGLECPNR